MKQNKDDLINGITTLVIMFLLGALPFIIMILVFISEGLY